MGRFAGSQGGSRSPISLTITWNSEKGEGFYFDPETNDKKFVTGFTGIIVDPNVFCITGKPQNGAYRVTSNLAKRGKEVRVSKQFQKQVANGRVTNEWEHVVTGKWTQIKEQVEGIRGQYTSATAVYVISMTVRNEDVEEKIKLERMVQFRLRGYCSVWAWDSACNSVEKLDKEVGRVDSRDIDGLAIVVKGSEDVESNGRSHKYPVINLREPQENDAFKLIMGKCESLYHELQEYLGSQDEVEMSDDEDGQLTPVMAPATSVVPDDDLPF